MTDARLSIPISTEVSRENVEYLDGVRLAVVNEDISLIASGSGDGDWDLLGDGVFGGDGGGGGGRGLLKPRNRDHNRNNIVSIIRLRTFRHGIYSQKIRPSGSAPIDYNQVPLAA